MSIPAEQIRPDKVAIYIRWSTEDQGEGTTLEVQMDSCKGYILSQGWSFRDDLVFVDDGISGATMERPALSRLRTLVRQRLVDCVVVYKLDRLSRSVLDMVKLVLEEWDGLCSIKSAREPIDTLSPTGKMFFYQLMSFAEWERSVIRDRMTSGRLRRAQQGKSPGGSTPYGYVKGSDGQFLEDPIAAMVVRRIFRLYLSGMGLRNISKVLTEEGLPAPAGGKWAQPTLNRIIRNEAYTGTFVYGKQRVKAGKKVAAPEPLVVKQGYYPALVTQEEFDTVQQLRADRPGIGRGRGTGRSMGSNSLLSGVLRCTCGRACAGIGFESRGASYRYYSCGAAQTTGAHICDSGNIRQDLLDQVVVERMMALYRGEHARQRLLDMLTKDIQVRHQEMLVARAAAEKEIKRLDESERRIKGLFIDGKLSIDEYRALQGEMNTKLAEAREQLQEAVRGEESARTSLEQHTQNTLLLDRVNEWQELSLAEKKQLLRHFIDQVTVYRDKRSNEVTCEIGWRWRLGDEDQTVEVIHQGRSTERTKAAAQGRKRVGGRFV